VVVRGQTLQRAQRSDGFPALGVQITFNNSFEKEIQNRMGRAWRAFYKHKDLLCCRSAPLVDCLRLLSVVVSTSLFWCSGSWNLTVRQISKLRGIEQSMLQKMILVTRQEHESTPEFMRRLRTKINRLKELHAFEDWDRSYYRSFFKWAGHVARLAQYEPSRITSAVLRHWDWKRIEQVAQENCGDQCHGRRIRTWRWERPLYKYVSGSSWQDAAQDKLAWQTQLEEMVCWRCRVHSCLLCEFMCRYCIGVGSLMMRLIS
jgi:hypothetical protein